MRTFGRVALRWPSLSWPAPTPSVPAVTCLKVPVGGGGTLVRAEGSMYEGQWLAGERHGQGKYTDATGDVYEGEYVKDEKQGQGKFSFATGGSYDGKYADGKKHGMGTYTMADGRVEVGCFDAGLPVGQGVRWSADRTEAWEVQAGKQGRSIPLFEAAKSAERIGLPPP